MPTVFAPELHLNGVPILQPQDEAVQSIEAAATTSDDPTSSENREKSEPSLKIHDYESLADPSVTVPPKLPNELEDKIFSHSTGVGNIIEVYYDSGTIQTSSSPSPEYRIFSALITYEKDLHTEEMPPDETAERRYQVLHGVAKGDPTRIFESFERAHPTGTPIELDPNTKTEVRPQAPYFTSSYILFFSSTMGLKTIRHFVNRMTTNDRNRIRNVAFHDHPHVSSQKFKDLLALFPNLQRLMLVSEL